MNISIDKDLALKLIECSKKLNKKPYGVIIKSYSKGTLKFITYREISNKPYVNVFKLEDIFRIAEKNIEDYEHYWS